MSTRHRRAKLALIIPAHNEQVVIASTIQSALKAGLEKQHIYVVDDASSDNTSKIAAKILGQANVLKVGRSGKAGAVKKAFGCFNIAERYQWVHVADADGVFGEEYFAALMPKLTRRYAAATGHVQSLPGGWISQFRTYEYTIGLEIMRRIQSWLGVITVIPGPTSCFRTDIFARIDFSDTSLTEDFDATLQIHRRKLGKIAYVPEAKAYTQDPKDYHDFTVQVARWYRGFFQGIKKYGIGLKLNRIDGYIGYMIGETVLMTIELAAVIALGLMSQRGLYVASVYVLADIAFQLGWTVFAAYINNRWDILKAFPLFYVLRFTNLYIFYKSFVEVVILKKFTDTKPGWDTRGRRYRIQTQVAVNKGA